MACKHANNQNRMTEPLPSTQNANNNSKVVKRLRFGVDSQVKSNDVLQNNLTAFEWATRNKLYPNFWGRYLNSDHALTKEEIEFLHDQGCKIAAIYEDSSEKKTEEQGTLLAKKIALCALELAIPPKTAVFLELKDDEPISLDYLYGFAKTMPEERLVPGFKANTDAKFKFDREFSRGMILDKAVFGKCLIWAVAPSLEEYDRVTTSHFIHPDNWTPYAPSGTTRNDIAIWQYGKNCHPILDDSEKETTFNVNLVRNDRIILENMF